MNENNRPSDNSDIQTVYNLIVVVLVTVLFAAFGEFWWQYQKFLAAQEYGYRMSPESPAAYLVGRHSGFSDGWNAYEHHFNNELKRFRKVQEEFDARREDRGSKGSGGAGRSSRQGLVYADGVFEPSPSIE